jgi:hypothetical protein
MRVFSGALAVIGIGAWAQGDIFPALIFAALAAAVSIVRRRAEF